MIIINNNISYIIQGQSNAQGQALPTEVSTPYKKRLNSCFIFNTKTLQWEALKAGINTSNYALEFNNYFNVEPNNGKNIGIELALSLLLRNYYGCQTYCFKYGWAGSGLLTSGAGGCWDSSLATDLFYKSQQYYKAGKKLGISTLSPSFLVWIQGEADIANPTTYKTKLTQFIVDSRKLYGQEMWIIIVTLSTNQTYMNSTQIATFKTMQRSLGSVIYTASTDAFTTQSGGSVINNCLVIDQNEACQNESGTFIHYNATAFENLANYCMKGIKQYIIK